MSYPAPPPAEQPPAGQGSRTPRIDGGGFFNDLFDVRFTRFVSLRLISIVYMLILAAVSILALVAIFLGFAAGPVSGLLALVLGALGWIIVVVLARVALEAFAVLFRIHDDTSRTADAVSARRGPAPAPSPPSAATPASWTPTHEAYRPESQHGYVASEDTPQRPVGQRPGGAAGQLGDEQPDPARPGYGPRTQVHDEATPPPWQ